MACLNPCIKYGFADRKGTIEVGKDADLVVISDDYQAQVTYARDGKSMTAAPRARSSMRII